MNIAVFPGFRLNMVRIISLLQGIPLLHGLVKSKEPSLFIVKIKLHVLLLKMQQLTC